MKEKLVRNLIPQVLKDLSIPFTSRVVADDVEFHNLLCKKLDEEVAEFQQSSEVEELADIFEVILALAQAQGVSREKFFEIAQKKTEEKGDFSGRIVLKKYE